MEPGEAGKVRGAQHDSFTVVRPRYLCTRRQEVTRRPFLAVGSELGTAMRKEPL